MDQELDQSIDQLDTDETIDPIALEAAIGRLTSCAARVFAQAESRAQAEGRSSICTEHLLLAIAADPDAAGRRALEEVGLDEADLRGRVAFIAGPPAPPNGATEPERSPRIERVVLIADRDASKRNQLDINTLNLMMGLLKERQGLAVVVLEVPGVGLERVGGALAKAFREGWSDS